MSLLSRISSPEVVQEAVVITKSAHEYVVEFQPGISFSDFQKAVLQLEEERKHYGYSKATCIYRKPSTVYHRKKDKTVSEFTCTFFMGSKTGVLCYTTTGRTGYYVSHMSWQNISKIVLRHPEHPDKKKKLSNDKDKFWNRVQKARFDEATWSNLKPDSFNESKHPFRYINKIFDSYDLETIRKGFEEKKSFRVWKNGSKRDYSAEGKLGDDGIYRAWFSSEYSGCGNGDYYLLLNPTCAVFMETD